MFSSLVVLLELVADNGDNSPVGSCSMLPLELGGCVDQTLRVYGVKNLRVVDGSVIPMVPSANTCQPIYALAEKVRLSASPPARLVKECIGTAMLPNPVLKLLSLGRRYHKERDLVCPSYLG